MKEDSYNKNLENQISNCYQTYPNTMRYYSQGEPEPFEY